MAARSFQRRIELGLTQARVAEHLGVAVEEVSAYEHGHVRMTPQVRYKLCSLYEVSPDWFYEGL